MTSHTHPVSHLQGENSQNAGKAVRTTTPAHTAQPTPAAPREKPAGLPRLAVNIEEAASMLGVSRDFFDEHVRLELRVVRRGRLKLIPVAELERWLDRSAARVLDDA